MNTKTRREGERKAPKSTTKQDLSGKTLSKQNMDDHFLMQMNYFVTRTSSSSSITGNILDLVFTNFESLVEDVAVFPYAFESDHFPVTFTLRRKFNRLKNVKRMVYS